MPRPLRPAGQNAAGTSATSALARLRRRDRRLERRSENHPRAKYPRASWRRAPKSGAAASASRGCRHEIIPGQGRERSKQRAARPWRQVRRQPDFAQFLAVSKGDMREASERDGQSRVAVGQPLEECGKSASLSRGELRFYRRNAEQARRSLPPPHMVSAAAPSDPRKDPHDDRLPDTDFRRGSGYSAAERLHAASVHGAHVHDVDGRVAARTDRRATRTATVADCLRHFVPDYLQQHGGEVSRASEASWPS